MFRTSQEFNCNVLNKTSSLPALAKTNALQLRGKGTSGLFGRYQRTPDADKYRNRANEGEDDASDSHRQIFVAPELTDVHKVQLLQFPNGVVRVPTTTNDSAEHFLIKRNGVKGNFEVKLESPSGLQTYAHLTILDQERLQVRLDLNEAGLYKIHVKCNSVLLPKSPFIIVTSLVENGHRPPSPFANINQERLESVSAIRTDASQVLCRGSALQNGICQPGANELMVDASRAGTDVLFVGICDPGGQCDEVNLKHLGNNVYRLIFQAPEVGQYVLAVKWGEEHVPGSPFELSLPSLTPNHSSTT